MAGYSLYRSDGPWENLYRRLACTLRSPMAKASETFQITFVAWLLLLGNKSLYEGSE